MTKLNADCYEILQLNKETATVSDIKKAYRTLALKCHPDKLANATEEDKIKANEQFQQIGFAYTILSDPQRKQRYDKTGSTDESVFEGEKDWTAYFKELWTGVVSGETIEKFKKEYQGSDEEKQDLYKAYNKFNGDMEKILSVIEGSEDIDVERFVVIIKEGIANSELKLFAKFEKSITKEAHEKRLKKIEKETKKAMKMKKTKKSKKEQEKDDIGSLALLMQQRNQERASKMNDIFESMEKKALKRQYDDDNEEEVEQGDLPNDEEFNKIQERLIKRQKSNTQNSGKKSKKEKA
ncbi:DnaJ-domain-containing protein [Backusella circina FSU 941]|nr:DnaJ-domain-containing protein [Backusella circina FSU 941]